MPVSLRRAGGIAAREDLARPGLEIRENPLEINEETGAAAGLLMFSLSDAATIAVMAVSRTSGSCAS
jgi:hypothetical protein